MAMLWNVGSLHLDGHFLSRGSQPPLVNLHFSTPILAESLLVEP